MTWWVELGAPENISFFNFSKGRTLMYVSEDVNNNVRMATKNNNENANVLNRSVIWKKVEDSMSKFLEKTI